jgi:hypothetical protein
MLKAIKDLFKIIPILLICGLFFYVISEREAIINTIQILREYACYEFSKNKILNDKLKQKMIILCDEECDEEC